MRQSQLLIPTIKENPSDADVASHRLMLRAGLIRQLAAGLYTWLPLGLRVIRKIETIIREELSRSGAQEVLMPVVQPAELWQESNRWDKMGPELLRLNDRHGRDFCLGPTHEEVITDMFRREIHSYRQMPCNFYQIQTKFRDEIRPRFGVMRAREFTMKDGYSFHMDQASFDETYAEMYDCYSRILKRMQLDFRSVEADTGKIGGANSHEFHVLADSGEDLLAYATHGNYAANVEKAEAAPPPPCPDATEVMEKVATPGVASIEQLSQFLDVAAHRTVKTLVVRGDSGPLALVLRGDHQLNELKAARLPGACDPLELASDAEVEAAMGCKPGSLGPVASPIEYFIDRDAAALADFICGANLPDVHYRGVNWGRDIAIPPERVVDIRNVVEGDTAPHGQGTLQFLRGIEVGHIFQLGTVYTEPLNATVLDPTGQSVTPMMGCYGMGVTRLVAAIIEQNHDAVGIIWPQPVAPFEVHIIALNYGKSEAVRTAANALFVACEQANIATLIDDRDERPGVKFAEADLLGIPQRIVVGERGLKDNTVEYRLRQETENQSVTKDAVLDRIKRTATRA